MNLHPVAKVFPDIPADEFRELVEDIGKYGLREPVWVDKDGLVIDGRHRCKACEELGVPVRTRTYEGSDLNDFVASVNLKRRHLSESQRAVVANAMAQICALPQRKVAQSFTVSRRSVQHARKVKQKGTVELQQAVKAGDVSVYAAAVLADLPKEKQTAIIEKGEDAVIRAANEIKKRKRARKKAARTQRKKAVPKELPNVTDRFRIHHGSIAEAMAAGWVEPESVDAIITDPPYGQEYLLLYGTLATVAAQVLKPGGLMLVMTGQAMLPSVLSLMCRQISLHYHWLLSYLLPGGNLQMYQKKVTNQWKPVIWFVKGRYSGDTVADTVRSGERDKDHHDAGQSQSGTACLVERFTDPGQLVFDPFLGGGTTGLVAVRMNRRFIGIEIEEEAYNTALARLNELNDGA